MIAVIDYGAGNLQSVLNALNRLRCEAFVTNDPGKLLDADAAILPGVGSFGDAVMNIEKSGIRDAITCFAKSGKPFLGICLGLQLLFERSEESPGAKGLGILKGEVTRFKKEPGLKIPQMGWNSIEFKQKSPLLNGIPDGAFMYFVHSYYLTAVDRPDVLATTQYGREFDSLVSHGNIFAAQFHPEKSGDTGLKILKNFADLTI